MAAIIMALYRRSISSMQAWAVSPFGATGHWYTRLMGGGLTRRLTIGSKWFKP
jgi:hypothetical protein